MAGALTRSRIPQPKLVALAVLAACSWNVQALTLGRFQVLSGTGEALRAEIDILEYSPQELQGLSARIAPPASFQAAGMEYNPGLGSVTTRIAQRSNGRPYISLFGQTPLRENFIDVILEAQWNTGRAVKNYALLLNAGANAPVSTPNGSAESQTALITPVLDAPVKSSSPTPAAPSRSTDDLQPASVELNARQIPVYRFSAAANNMAQANVATATPPTTDAPALRPRRANRQASQSAEASQITVRPGDTLSQIAMANLPPNVSLDQMMVAIQQANPEAFIESNVNLVKAGTVLQMPDAQQAASVSKDDARRLVVQQTRAFIEYSRRIAQSPLRIRDKSTGLEVSGKVETAAAPAPAAALSQDTLTLSKGSVSAASEEARVAAEKEARETDTQVAAVTKNLQDLQALAQGQAPAASEAPGLPPLPSSVEASIPNNTPGKDTAAASAASADAKSSVTFMDRLSNDRNTQIWAGALVLAAAFTAYWMARRRRRDDEDSFLPEYDDVIAGSSYGAPVAGVGSPLPGHMPNLDLNLDPAAPVSPVDRPDMPPMGPPSAGTPDFQGHETDLSKLNLAAQLLAKGEHELARALLGSVLSSSSAELRSRAQQLLSQLP